ITDIRGREPHSRATQKDVLAYGGLTVETQRKVDQRLGAPIDYQTPGRGRVSTIEHLEQRRLSGTILTQKCHTFSIPDREVEILEQWSNATPRRIEHGTEKHRPPTTG